VCHTLEGYGLLRLSMEQAGPYSSGQEIQQSGLDHRVGHGETWCPVCADCAVIMSMTTGILETPTRHDGSPRSG
jgi:hypothetical protein